jgi:hypothetical protein
VLLLLQSEGFCTLDAQHPAALLPPPSPLVLLLLTLLLSGCLSHHVLRVLLPATPPASVATSAPDSSLPSRVRSDHMPNAPARMSPLHTPHGPQAGHRQGRDRLAPPSSGSDQVPAAADGAAAAAAAIHAASAAACSRSDCCLLGLLLTLMWCLLGGCGGLVLANGAGRRCCLAQHD